MSFSPLNAHAELACSGAAVLFVLGTQSEFAGSEESHGVPGGPFTSPASAPPAETPTSIATEAATTSSRFILYPLFLSRTLPGVLYVRSLLLR